MAEKVKPLNYDSAKEKLGKTKEELAAKREELATWMKEKKLKKTDDHSTNENEKVAKKWSRLTQEIKDLETKRSELTTFVKENKPKKERVAKYAYPAGATSDDKKKFRQKARAAAKAAGVSISDYLADPAKHDAAVAAKRASKPKKEKAPVEGEGKKKKKAVEATTEEAPKKKKPKVEAAVSED